MEIAAGIAVLTIIAILSYFARLGRQVREKEEQKKAALAASEEQHRCRRADAAYASVENVVRVWGKFLESSPLRPLEIRDVRGLPYPKAKIESACLTAIAASADHPQYQQALCVSLLSLAQFQEGVGAPVDEPVSVFAASHRDAIKPGSGQDVRELARALAREATTEKREQHQRLWQLVETDIRRIMAQLPNCICDQTASPKGRA